MTPAWRGALFGAAAIAVTAACVPSGNSTPSDAGPAANAANAAATPPARPSIGVMTAAFEDDFNRAGSGDRDAARPAPSGSGSGSAPSADLGQRPRPTPAGDAAFASEARRDGGASDAGSLDTPRERTPVAAPPSDDLGPNWTQAGTTVWHIENGRLCGQGAHNHGVWLNRVLPVNARIEFDALSDSPDGDLKAEFWGDGQSAARSISYTDATSYLTIFGGWKNTFHVLARINEHGTDRKEIKIDPTSDDPREKPVTRGQSYHFKVERTDGRTVKWSVDGVEMLNWPDAVPLTGQGHDHFGFNNWEVRVCFDNVKVTPVSSL